MNYSDKKTKKYILVIVLSLLIIYFGYRVFFEEDESSSVNITQLEYPQISYDIDVEFDENNIVVANSEILISESGSYVFSGDYEDVTVTIDIADTEDDEPVYIILDNATMSSTDEYLIYDLSASSVVVYATEDSTNYLSIDYDVTSDASKAVIYSKDDLVINGLGTIYIETNFNDGIKGSDDVVIENATLYIESQGDGIVANDYLAITDASITIESQSDGMKASNSEEAEKGNVLIESGEFNISSVKDAISAANTLEINDGEFDIDTSGGYQGINKEITLGEGGSEQSNGVDFSCKGLKALDILITGGNFDMSIYEDAIHADNDLYISGGTFIIEAGDDGVHADNNLVIDDINLEITISYEGIEGSNITINGGDISATVLDDAINAGELLTINGGTIYLYSNGDGIDSNGALTITGGTIVIENEAIYSGGDYSIDVTGEIIVTGGTIVDEDGNEVDYENVMSSSQNQMTLPGGNSSRR